jgi:hypothetical protein
MTKAVNYIVIKKNQFINNDHLHLTLQPKSWTTIFPRRILALPQRMHFLFGTSIFKLTLINNYMKQFLPFFKIPLFSFFLLIVGNWSVQTNFVARPATFVAAIKFAAAVVVAMAAVIDGECKGFIGKPTKRALLLGADFLPSYFSINSKAVSTVPPTFNY